MTHDVKILICDDSGLVRKKLRAMLTEQGNPNIREAENGEMAVLAVKEERPDLVFMDIVMPVKTGIEALKEIRQYDPSIRVVMASSVGTQSNLLEAMKLGAFDFVQKPFDAAAVSRILEKIVNERGNA